MDLLESYLRVWRAELPDRVYMWFDERQPSGKDLKIQPRTAGKNVGL
jgi:hypothetical protein